MKNMVRSADMEVYWDVILQLRHQFDNPTLDREIQQLVKNSTASSRFLIKMEIMNLSKEVNRVIDLRTYFEGRCEKFTYQGAYHYFDDTSKIEFLNEINRYNGSYTLGVYEYIVQRAKTRCKSDTQGLLNNKIPKTKEIHLTQFFAKNEEKLHFIKNIRIFYNNPEKMTQSAFDNFAIEADTTDISATGLSIKIEKEKILRRNGLIHVWMHEIENEFKFSERVIITYEIKNSFEENGDVFFNLSYHSTQFSNVKDEFINFSERYINAQQWRSDLPIAHTTNAIKAKIAEQFLITKLTALPIFLIQRNDSWVPVAQFTTKHNSKIGLLGKVNNNKNFLRSLCNLPIIQSQIATGDKFSEYLLVMPIKDKSNQIHYIALPYKNVFISDFIKKMTAAAHHKGLLTLYRLDGTSITPENQCHVASSLPLSAYDTFENINQQPLERAKSLSKQLKRMLLLTDLSASIGDLNILDINKNNKFNDVNLSQYVLKKSEKQFDIFEARAETNDFRMEDRFLCEVNLQIQENKSSELLPCSSINISTRGLKVKLSKSLHLHLGDTVLVHFPELPDNGNRELINQPYSIVGIDSPLEYRLIIVGNACDHQGRKLMRSYIYKHIKTLKPMGYGNEIYGLSRALRNLFANNLQFTHGITARKGALKYIQDIAHAENAAPHMSKGMTRYDILGLMHADAFRSAIINNIEFSNKEDPYQTLYFVVMPRVRKNGEEYFYVKQIVKSKSRSELVDLLKNLSCIGAPKLLRVECTKKGRVFNKYFRDEMSYLERFAATKVNEIESELRDTIGIFAMSDITELIA